MDKTLAAQLNTMSDIHIPLLTFSSSGEIVSANPTAIEIFGIQKRNEYLLFPGEVQDYNKEQLVKFAEAYKSNATGVLFLRTPILSDYEIKGQIVPLQLNGEMYFQAIFPHQTQQLIEFLEFVESLSVGVVDLDDVAKNALQLVLQITGGSGAMLHVAEYRKKKLRLAYSIGISRRALVVLNSIDFSEGIIGKALTQKRSVFIHDLRAAEERVKRVPSDLLERYKVRSYLAFPLVANELVIGVIGVVYLKTVQPPSNFQDKLLTGLSVSLGQLIHKHQVEARERKYFTQLSVLRELPDLWRKSKSTDELFRTTTSTIIERLNFWDLSFFHYIPSKRVLKKIVTAGGMSKAIPDNYEQSVEVGVLGWVVRNGKTLYIPDTSKSNLYHPFPTHRNRCELAIPVKIGERIFGVLNMESHEPDAFDDIDIWTMETLSQHLALYLEYSRLLEEEKIRVENLSLINQVSQFLNSTIDYDTIINGFCSNLVKLFGLHYVSIHLYNPQSDKLTKIARAGGGASQRKLFTESSAQKGILGWVVKHRKWRYVPNVKEEPAYLPVAEDDYGSELCFPILIGNDLFGVLNIESQKTDAFDTNMRIVLHSITQHLNQALRNAILFQEIRQEKTKSEAVLSAMNEGVMMISTDGQLIFSNHAAQNYFPQLNQKEPKLHQVLPFWESVKSRLDTEMIQQRFEWSGVKKIWEINLIKIDKSEGKERYLLIFADVTERKKIERRRLENDRLQVAIKVAGSVAHEINQPLTGILGYCSLLLEDLDKESELYNDIKLIEKQANRIAFLIQKFQNVVRLKMKPYLKDTEILDIDQSGGKTDE